MYAHTPQQQEQMCDACLVWDEPLLWSTCKTCEQRQSGTGVGQGMHVCKPQCACVMHMQQ